MCNNFTYLRLSLCAITIPIDTCGVSTVVLLTGGEATYLTILLCVIFQHVDTVVWSGYGGIVVARRGRGGGH